MNKTTEALESQKPLSDDEIVHMYHDQANMTFDMKLDPFKFARAIEAAHGIGVKDED